MKYINTSLKKLLNISLLTGLSLATSGLSADTDASALDSSEIFSDFVFIKETDLSFKSIFKEWSDLKEQGLSPYVFKGMIFGSKYMTASESDITNMLVQERLPKHLKSLTHKVGNSYAYQAAQNLSRLVGAASFFGRPVAQDVVATIATGRGSAPLLDAVSRAALRVYPANGSLSNWFLRNQITGGVFENLSWIFSTTTFYAMTGAEYLAQKVYEMGSASLYQNHIQGLEEGSILDRALIREQLQNKDAAPAVLTLEQHSKAIGFLSKLSELKDTKPQEYTHFVHAIIFGEENAQKSIEENMENLEQQLKALGLTETSPYYSAVMNVVSFAGFVAHPFIQTQLAYFLGGLAGPTILHVLNMGALMAEAGLGKSWLAYLSISYLEGTGVKLSVNLIRYISFYLIHSLRTKVPALMESAYSLAAAYFPVAYEAGTGWCSWAYNYAYDVLWGQSPVPGAATSVEPQVQEKAQPKEAAPSSSYASSLYRWGSWALGYGY